MINVLSIVSYHVLPAVVGGQKGIALFHKYFSRHVHMICIATEKNDPANAEDYEVLNILSNSPLRYLNIFYFFTIRKIIRERKITHVLLEHPYYGWLGILLKKNAGIELVVHSHNIEGLRWKVLKKWWWKILWRYEAWVHRQADFNFFKQEDDKNYALRHFNLSSDKCIVVTYGIEQGIPPSPKERSSAKNYLQQKFSILENNHILLFNGAFNYSPNLNGLKNIISEINPALQKIPEFQYTILICGRDIPSSISERKIPGIVFAGFVDDITVYFKGADIFINPVIEGGGIKTKLVEALGFDMNVVSTRNGAIGIDPAICNNKLMIVNDGDWNAFAEAIKQSSLNETHTPPSYYRHFYWDDIAKRAAEFITKK
jgi:glycosyltransferase involved in cell wall biosynthesis